MAPKTKESQKKKESLKESDSESVQCLTANPSFRAPVTWIHWFMSFWEWTNNYMEPNLWVKQDISIAQAYNLQSLISPQGSSSSCPAPRNPTTPGSLPSRNSGGSGAAASLVPENWAFYQGTCWKLVFFWCIMGFHIVWLFNNGISYSDISKLDDCS